jgi:ABC-2 type transport system permease protein
MMGLFPLITMFLVTSITMLRERTSGTLERLMTMPMGRIDLIAGYALAFSLCTVAQVALVAGVAAGPLGLRVSGSLAAVAALALANALLGVALGLLVSAFARSEFQAVQFMPAVVFPQLLLCGLFAPREGMAAVLRWLSDVLPLTYAYDALARSAAATVDRDVAVDVGVTVGSTIVAVVLAAVTIRRRTA